jgi:hypothetical protein
MPILNGAGNVAGNHEVRKTASFFECFPYVCPEPVLAKRSFSYINGAKMPFSAGTAASSRSVKQEYAAWRNRLDL